ncbi:MAG: hypothetical protein RLZZ579_232, partial [Actinomycetota bacterium]
HLAARGIDFEQAGQSQAQNADFLLIGDASRAALRFYQPGLEALVSILIERLNNERPTLIVGSSYEFLSSRIGLNASVETTRVSDFVSIRVNNSDVVGYLNSSSNLPGLEIRGGFIATKLYGPLLAFNPDLLADILHRLGAEPAYPEGMLKSVESYRARITS